MQELRPIEQLYQAKFGQAQQIPYSDDQLLEAIQPLLNLVNARYIVTPRPLGLDAQNFPEVFAAEGVRLYANRRALPWFQLLPSSEVIEDEAEILRILRDGEVDLASTVILEAPLALALPGADADRSRDSIQLEEYDYHEGVIRVRVSAAGPRMLVVSDNYHPNWQATVDATPVDIVRANYVWHAVAIPPGNHEVLFAYHSTPVAAARAAAIGSLLILLTWGGSTLRRRRTSEQPSPP